MLQIYSSNTVGPRRPWEVKLIKRGAKFEGSVGCLFSRVLPVDLQATLTGRWSMRVFLKFTLFSFSVFFFFRNKADAKVPCIHAVFHALVQNCQTHVPSQPGTIIPRFVNSRPQTVHLQADALGCFMSCSLNLKMVHQLASKRSLILRSCCCWAAGLVALCLYYVCHHQVELSSGEGSFALFFRKSLSSHLILQLPTVFWAGTLAVIVWWCRVVRSLTWWTGRSLTSWTILCVESF
jgi:hypothetical protein